MGGIETNEHARAKAGGRGPADLLRRLLGTGYDRSVKLAASSAFFIRIANAGITYLSQIIMARWMGAFEFGIYVYVWTWVLIVGLVADLGFANTAQRVIPGYLQRGQLDYVRGFIHASRWIPGIFVTILAILAAGLIWLLQDRLDSYLVLPMLIACIALPPYGLTDAQDGTARAFGWINLALVPPYIVRPSLLLLVMMVFLVLRVPLNAGSAMEAAVISTWLTSMGQIIVFDRRFRKWIEPGPRSYARREWIVSSLPVLFSTLFQFMLSYVGVLVLQVHNPPDDIAVFYAATKLTAIVSMVYFSVAASAAYRFAALHAEGNVQGLQAFYRNSVSWTFWPTLLVGVGIVAFAKPFLWLFGSEFTYGYWLVVVLTLGLVIRASIGPGEQILNMLGHQRMSAMVYAISFLFNLVLCLLIIDDLGPMGAAIAATASIVLETMLLHLAIRDRVGIVAFISFRRKLSGSAGE